MNREIQFRLWNYSGEKSKMFYDPNEVMECLKQQMVFNNGNEKLGYNHIGDGSLFMQYTGLKDKNGKKIWESDIIKTERGDWGIIVWNAPFFEVTVSEDQSSMYSREWFSNVEVTGNIYENPLF